MKKFENRFGVLLEFRNVGANVVSVKVSMTLRFNRFDDAFLAEQVLQRLLPEKVSYRRLYDGSFILVSPSLLSASVDMVAPCCRDLSPIVGDVEFDDGSYRKVEVSLHQSDGCRLDYSVLDTRFIELRGTISTDAFENETVEE